MESNRNALLLIPVVAVLLGLGAVLAPISNDHVNSSIILQVEKTVTEKPTITGYVTLQVFDRDGNLKQTVENHNLIVDGGLDEMAEAIFGVGGVGTTNFDYLEIGTSATAPSAGQTALVSPIGGCARVQDVSPDLNTLISGETSVSVISSFSGITCAGGIQEAGIFNSLTGGQMLGRSTFGIVTIASGDTMNLNYTVTLT